MKFVVCFAVFVLVISCQTTSSKVETVSEKQFIENSNIEKKAIELSSIRNIDFQNFTFPWTKTFGGKEKSFTLKNGFIESADDEKLSLKSISYINVTDNFDEEALVNVKIEDGNATYEVIYVFAIENYKPKLLESFEFGEDNIYFATAFVAHSELVIETYHQLITDSECCPSVIEIAYYKWQKDKFVLQDEPQKIPNGYVERTKKLQKRS